MNYKYKIFSRRTCYYILKARRSY